MKEHTPEWHQWRARGIGGSDIASIAGPLLGFKAWGSPWEVYLTKTGQLATAAPNARMKYGAMVEEAVCRAWAEAKGYEFVQWDGKPLPSDRPTVPTVIWKPPPLAHKDSPEVRGSPDALLVMPDGTFWILEVKTTGVESRYYWQPEPPMHVLVQGQWYCGVLASHGYVVGGVVTLCEINHDEPLEWRHEFRPRLFERLARIGVDFWQRHVVPQVPPPLDGSTACHKHVEGRHRREKGSVMRAGPLEEMIVAEYLKAAADAERAEEVLEASKAAIKAAMGPAETMEAKAAKFVLSKTAKGHRFNVYRKAAE